MSKPVLELQNIQKSFQQGKIKLEVLKDATLTLDKGEILALVGPSGCGKSTLLQIAGLLEWPDGGIVTITGHNTKKLPDRKKTRLRRDALGFVYQFHHLLPEFSALENVMLPQLIAGKRKKQTRSKATDLLQKLGLGERLKHRPAELSGGEQQRVAIARALANNPAILLADEPTGNLDPHTAEEVFALLLNQVRTLNLAFLLVTHNPDLAKKADRVMTIKEGVLTGIK